MHAENSNAPTPRGKIAARSAPCLLPHSRTVFCLAGSLGEAEKMLDMFVCCGLPREKTSFLFREPHMALGNITPNRIPPSSSGARLDSRLKEILSRMKFIAIPGTGLFLAAGPIWEASHVANGEGLNRILSRIGISMQDAVRLRNRLVSGGVLVCFHTNDSLEAKLVRMILLKAGIHDASSTHWIMHTPRASMEQTLQQR